MASDTDPLVALAQAVGVTTSVREGSARSRPVEQDVLIRTLGALGVKSATQEERAAAMARREADLWARVLPSHVVLREGWTPWVPVRLGAGTEFESVIVREDGERVDPVRAQTGVRSHSVGGIDYEETTLELPRGLPLGYHELQVSAGGRVHTCPVIVTPARMVMPSQLSGVKVWGVAGQLYALRSERSWGIGDTADLAELGTWAARSGADYVNVGPINCDDPVPTIDPNPYRPVSRRFLDPLAIRVEEVRELGYLSAAEHQLVEWHGDDARRLNLSDEVDRDAVWYSKRAALRMIFNVERSHRRRRDFEEFLTEGGQELLDFATWCVLAGEHGLPFTAWPQELLDARGDGVSAFRDAHAGDVEFECWLQWIARAQFADASREVKAAGMRIGVVHDVAPGTIDGGFAQWARPRDHADGVVVGTCDERGEVSTLGLSALTPAALARDGFALWRGLIRDALAISGAVRLERVDMLFRQWWHAPGQPQQGTHVRFDHEALIGVLLLEAQRAGALVVAGDESGAPTWVRDYLIERGLITSRALWSERSGASLEAQEKVPHRVVTSLAAKDDAPAAAFLTGAQVQEVRRHRLERDVDAYAERAQAQRAALVRQMAARELTTQRATVEEQVGALHRHLSSGPSLMFTVRLGDLVGDVRRPGVHGHDHVHAMWRLPLAGPDEGALSLDDVMTSRRAKRVIRVVMRG